MTDWKELARKHEESANEYARMNYELEAIIADLLEALKDLVTDYEEIGGEDIYADAYNRAKQAIRKAEEQIK